ncbi:MAG: DNA-3-methyladenine glycosylase I [Malacoplasma sp.]|nr:DNA-3-methyladenine glycosylase I [Malacoplasma sp.]
MKNRCSWAKTKSYQEYHDKFWGKKSEDESFLFELLILETQAAGLNFSLIWSKKDEYEKYFDFKNPVNNLKINQKQIDDILLYSNLIKNKLKIKSIINNSNAYLKLVKKYGSLKKYIWDNPNLKDKKRNPENITKNRISDYIQKELKQFGFSFLGSVTIFSYLQAIGFYDDHQPNCYCYKPLD